MLELLIKEIDPLISQHAQVYRSLSSKRTIETLATAKTIWNNSEFILTVGADLITQLPKWYQAKQLLSQVELLIVPRTGNRIESIDLQRLTAIGAKITIAPLATPLISSTLFRESHSIQGLTPRVATYIHQHNLYSINEPQGFKSSIF